MSTTASGLSDSRRSLEELEPLVRDRILAIDEPVALADWAAVVERASLRAPTGRRSRARQVLVALGATLLAISVAGPAFGLRLSSIINFGNANDAPASVEHDFAEFDLGAPAELAPGAIAAQTRLITSASLPDGTHTLYVSPTQAGGFCFEWSSYGGGCDQFGTTPLNITWTTGSTSGGSIAGTVASAYVASVEINLSDATTATPTIIWLSAPIHAGFFLYATPPATAILAIRGYDNHGKLVARETPPGTEPDTSSPPKFANLDQKKIAATATTSDGVATAYTAPSMTDGLCAWVSLAGVNTPLYGFNGCLPHRYAPQGVVFRFQHTGRSTLFIGAAASSYSKITLGFLDGTIVTVRPTQDGLLLYSLPASLSERPTTATVTAYRTDGRIAFSEQVTGR